MYKDKKNYRNKYIDLSYGKHASPRGGRRAQGIGSITA